MPHNWEKLKSQANEWGRAGLKQKIAAGLFVALFSSGLIMDNYMPSEFELLHYDASPLGDSEVKIMTANVHSWQGDKGYNFNDFAKVLDREQPDIVCMQEVLADGGELDKLHEAGYNVMFSTTKRDLFKGRYGNAVLSKAPLEPLQYMPLPNPQTVTPRNAIMFRVQTTSGQLNITNVHLSTDEGESELQADYMFERMGDQLQIACGDLNRTPKLVEESALGQLHPSALERPPSSTFPAKRPRIEIDFILPGCGELVEHKPKTVEIGSDHLAKLEVVDISSC